MKGMHYLVGGIEVWFVVFKGGIIYGMRRNKDQDKL